MAGILDKKTRFIDFVITQEGKRQLATGKLRAEYASISDAGTFYKKSEKDNVNDRIYFQVMERPENVIVIEKDDSGKLLKFDFSPSGSIVGDNVFDKDAKKTNLLELKAVTGSQFASTSETIMRKFLDHFRSNMFVGTYFQNGQNSFEVDNKNLTFTISNSVPFKKGPAQEMINVNNAEPFFFDSKLSHLDNFKFLPPVNTDGTNYGSYTDLRSRKRESWEDIKASLGFLSYDETEISPNINNPNIRLDKQGDMGVINRKKLLPVNTRVLKEFKTINFTKTSSSNNLMMQIFEDGKKAKFTKLDIVDAGSFYVEDDVLGRYEKRIFYVGKVYFDDYNVPTFINIFTIILD